MKDEKSVFSSVVDELKFRVSAHFFGPFLFSVVVINYRILLVFFGEGGFEQKIKFIDSTLYCGLFDYFLWFLVYPFLSAVVYLVIVPFLNRAALKVKVGHQNAEKKIENSSCLSPEESYSLRAAYTKRLDDLNSELLDLQSKNAQLTMANRLVSEYGWRVEVRAAECLLQNSDRLALFSSKEVLPTESVEVNSAGDFRRFFNGKVPKEFVDWVLRHGVSASLTNVHGGKDLDYFIVCRAIGWGAPTITSEGYLVFQFDRTISRALEDLRRAHAYK